MPNNYKHIIFYTMVLVPVIMIFSFKPMVLAYEGIENYYLRYDVKSSQNKIIDDNLLMIPAKNDFRAEKFSQIITTGVISAAPGESKASINKRIRNNALKTILVNKGLKSVETKDLDTVVSYEGAVITPLNILKSTYNEKESNYVYEVQVEFSPIAFPDKWEKLNMKYKVKEIFYNFLEFFR